MLVGRRRGKWLCVHLWDEHAAKAINVWIVNLEALEVVLVKEFTHSELQQHDSLQFQIYFEF